MTSINQQLVDALGIMVMGMGLVFIFLSILIVGITIVAKFNPIPQPVKPVPGATNTTTAQGLDPKLVAAITSAIHQYRA
ncbi:OadG family protein [Shewanella gaetbuli]|uniref:Probable oxaloacetate decarboxylase gamma chain n=1 Tax=Shewanella gaetbuli TaxID=220752 RepID=A0A9X1ZHH4_9GAMM|nr:OadG family transporter subunit [Shewanella gaetbuli]MCL1141818.1 OadG family protein [Shewanella gaetbuli]